jgi:proline iminopeptidase
MRRWTKRIAAGAGALLGLLAAALVAGFVATRGDHRVARTVTDDPSLPHVTIDGVRLHVRTFGDPERPPVIVVHGGPGSSARALLPLRALADRYFVVLYDQRGGGLSERVADERLTLDGFFDELDGIVDHFGRGRPVRLVGHSWGAMLVSGYLGRHPEKVVQAVLAEPGMLTAETAALLMSATNGMRPPLTLGVGVAAAKAWLESLYVRGPDADARRDHLAAALFTADIEDHPIAGYFCGRDLGTARLEDWRFGSRVAPGAVPRGAAGRRLVGRRLHEGGRAVSAQGALSRRELQHRHRRGPAAAPPARVPERGARRHRGRGAHDVRREAGGERGSGAAVLRGGVTARYTAPGAGAPARGMMRE